MDKIQITDDLLYNLVPKAEILLLNQIPASDDKEEIIKIAKSLK